MQGDTQRSLGSFKEIHRVHALRSGNLSEAMELAAKRDSAFVEAESFYKKSLELCQPAVQAWYDREYWYSYVDNLLSLSNLAVHRWYTGSTPTVSQDEVAQSFRQLEEALEQLHQKTVQPNTTPLSQYQQAMLRGKELGYQLLMGKYYDRLATWNWLCYLQLQYTQQEQVKRDQLLHEYMVNLIKSLNCYIHFQPDTLNTSEYSHGLPNIGWLEARIDTNLKGNNERNMALQVARELENNPDLANGWRLFTYMASLRDQLNLSYI